MFIFKKRTRNKPKTEARGPSFQSLMFWAGITAGLCGAVFGLWEMKLNRELTADNNSLMEKRLEFIDHIKRRNREIMLLRNVIDSIQKGPEITAPVDNGYGRTINGMPVSFDNGAVSGKVVALTFDGSSLSNAAGEILDTLKSRGVRATVFITGDFIRRYPDAVKRIVAEGHEAGNHTFSHPHLTSWTANHAHITLSQISEAFLCHELFKVDSMFFSLTGKHCAPLWRAPFGEKNREICLWAQHCGYLHIGWRQGKTWKLGLDSNDWIPDEETPGFHTPEEVLEKIMALSQSEPYGINGGIILMHLGTVRKDSRAQVHRILGKLIDSLKERGYSFVTVSEMLKQSNIDVSELEKNRQNRNIYK
jgi:peptidoglycan/xylan/chitin deacetylase (PgdA/CDA1 family)